jgi:hypothetical protein
MLRGVLVDPGDDALSGHREFPLIIHPSSGQVVVI